MNAPRHDGFTLVELMAAVALSAVVMGAMISLSDQATRGAADAGQRAEQLDDFRDAMQLVAADLRAARRVEVDAEGRIRVSLPVGERVWTVAEGLLARTDDRETRIVASEVRALHLSREDRLWRVALIVGRGVRIETAVSPRTEAAR